MANTPPCSAHTTASSRNAGVSLDIETAVSGHQRGIRAVQLQPLFVKEKHGHARFVFRLIPNLFHLEFVGIDRHIRFGPYQRARAWECHNYKWSPGLRKIEMTETPAESRDRPVIPFTSPNAGRAISPEALPSASKTFSSEAALCEYCAMIFPPASRKSSSTRRALGNHFLPVFLRRIV